VASVELRLTEASRREPKSARCWMPESTTAMDGIDDE
jgi:hypothetical protein